MQKFPGVIKRGGCNGRGVILNEEQKEWFITNYPKTETKRIADAMGVHLDTAHWIARRLGVTKSKEGLKAIRRRATKRARNTNLKNGFFDRLKGKPVSEATTEGNRRRWQEIKEGKRLSPLAILKKMHPKKFIGFIKKQSEDRHELIRKEKLRIKYGMKKNTELNILQTPYTRSQLHHRCNALKRGYLLDEDCSEGTKGRYIIYYDEETNRSPKFEANLIADGFKIEDANAN